MYNTTHDRLFSIKVTKNYQFLKVITIYIDKIMCIFSLKNLYCNIQTIDLHSDNYIEEEIIFLEI